MSENIIDYLIEDLFKDDLYKYFFISDKINGIQTNVDYLKLYFENLKKLAFSDNNFSVKLLRILNTPLQPDILLKFKLFHNNILEEDMNSFSEENIKYEPVLPVGIYFKLESNLYT